MTTWIIVGGIYLLCNMLTMIYTGYLVSDCIFPIKVLFPMIIVYENLRKTYTKLGSIIATVFVSLFMVVHVIFMLLVGLFAVILGLFESLWNKLFLKR